MPPEKRGEPCNIAWVDFSALRSEVCQHLLHVNGIPMCDDIEGQAKGTQLLFLPLFEGVSDFTPISVMYFSGEFMTEFLLVELDENTATVIGIVDVVQDMQGLDEPPQMHERTGECGGAIPNLQNAHDARCLEVAQFQRTCEAHQIFPVVKDQFVVDGPLCHLTDAAVLIRFPDTPNTGPADVSQPWTKVDKIGIPTARTGRTWSRNKRRCRS